MTTPSLPELPAPDVPNTRLPFSMAFKNGSYSAEKVREIVASALAADRAATAPDERAAFEAWALSEEGGWWPDALTRIGDCYKAGAVTKQWVGWKARSFAAVGAGAAELPEPAAWLIKYEQHYKVRRAVHLHNAVADYRDFDPSATSTPLYAAPLGAVAVDAAPQQPNSQEILVDSVGAPVGLSDAANPASPWIAVSERLPEHGQTVAFVARLPSRLHYPHGRVLGGRYSAEEYSGGFSTPGLVVEASHWMPLPAPPALGMPEPGPAAPDGVIAGTTEWTKEGTPLPAPPAEAQES